MEALKASTYKISIPKRCSRMPISFYSVQPVHHYAIANPNAGTTCYAAFSKAKYRISNGEAYNTPQKPERALLARSWRRTLEAGRFLFNFSTLSIGFRLLLYILQMTLLLIIQRRRLSIIHPLVICRRILANIM